jgi:protein phosphatase 2C-like protein
VHVTADIYTLAGNAENEDRAGIVGNLAWVIDGATDVVEAPLTPGPTDASWIAETLDSLLREHARAPLPEIAGLPAQLAQRLESEFRRVASRQPDGRQEHPSAAGMIVNVRGQSLDYVGIGDCSLLVKRGSDVRRIGISEDDAGDRWVAEALSKIRSEQTEATAETAREQLWPKLRLARRFMNQVYGVFSITPTPRRFILSGSVPIVPGDWALLASDGLMRLVDVFRRYSSEELLLATIERGVASLGEELRELELADGTCVAFPRAKRHDDTTGLLMSFRA